jgi:hypothetical protein
LAVDAYPTTVRDVLDPEDVRALEPAAHADVWVYRYRDADTGWQLSIATHAEPHSGKLSLGGFRIAPESRTSLTDFDSDREAIGLALGMEEKVQWSRLLRVGGPLAAAARGRVVGGKCVLHPTPEARVGQPRDRKLLDWALACFADFERTSGVFLTTGQDLGHGRMSDGATESLAYLNSRFAGSVHSDTSVPTAEGNFHLLCGMLRGAGLEPARAQVGLIGAGHIGRHMLGMLRETGTAVQVLESNAATRASLATSVAGMWPVEEKAAFLDQPLDAIVVNAAGGTLDRATCERIARNDAVQAVCGSENLTMPDPRGTEVLLAGRVAFCPTELGGMMGYLTALEEYLAKRAGQPFVLRTVLDAARRLEVVGREGMERVIASGWTRTFEDVVRERFSTES